MWKSRSDFQGAVGRDGKTLLHTRLLFLPNFFDELTADSTGG